MTAPAAAPAPLGTVRRQAQVWWRGLARRERQALRFVAAVIGAFAVWSIFVQPAWRSIGDAPAQLDRLDAQLQQMQRTAVESQRLRATAPVSAAQAGLALKSATDRLGDRAKLSQRGDRATLTFTNLNAEALRAWLNEARGGARARPIELQLQRSADGYTGSLVVSVGVGA